VNIHAPLIQNRIFLLNVKVTPILADQYEIQIVMSDETCKRPPDSKNVRKRYFNQFSDPSKTVIENVRMRVSECVKKMFPDLKLKLKGFAIR